MKKKLAGILVTGTFILTLAAVPTLAQQGIPIGPGDGDGNTTPIGGMAVLAALGGGYAIKKLRDGKRET